MWISILFGLFLIAIAALMLKRNKTAWLAAQADGLEEREHDFLYRQYRRRMQANWMVAIVGAAIALGVWVTEPLVAAAYWLGVVLVVGWMALLAVADLVTTRMYYGRLHREQLDERALLEAQLDQIRRRSSNGRPKQDNPHEDPE